MLRSGALVVFAFAAAACSKASPVGGDPDADEGNPPDAPDDRIDAASSPDADQTLPDAPADNPDAPPPDASVDASPPDASPPDAAPIPITLSQNGATNIVANNSVACRLDLTLATRENSYYRAFTLSEHGVVGALTINAVSFGVETADADTAGTGTTQPAAIRIHTYSGTVGPTLDVAQMIQVAGINITIPDSATNTIVTHPIAATIPAGGTFVVELAIPDSDPDGDLEGHIFFIGTNSAGQIKPGYIRAPACGIAPPTTLTQAGFPTVHEIITVNGTYLP
jgi:hypothetical protein